MAAKLSPTKSPPRLRYVETRYMRDEWSALIMHFSALAHRLEDYTSRMAIRTARPNRPHSAVPVFRGPYHRKTLNSCPRHARRNSFVPEAYPPTHNFAARFEHEPPKRVCQHIFLSFAAHSRRPISAIIAAAAYPRFQASSLRPHRTFARRAGSGTAVSCKRAAENLFQGTRAQLLRHSALQLRLQGRFP